MYLYSPILFCGRQSQRGVPGIESFRTGGRHLFRRQRTSPSRHHRVFCNIFRAVNNKPQKIGGKNRFGEEKQVRGRKNSFWELTTSCDVTFAIFTPKKGFFVLSLLQRKMIVILLLLTMLFQGHFIS